MLSYIPGYFLSMFFRKQSWAMPPKTGGEGAMYEEVGGEPEFAAAARDGYGIRVSFWGKKPWKTH